MWSETQLKIKNAFTKSKAALLASTCNVSDPCLQNADETFTIPIQGELHHLGRSRHELFCIIWEEADMNYFF